MCSRKVIIQVSLQFNILFNRILICKRRLGEVNEITAVTNATTPILYLLLLLLPLNNLCHSRTNHANFIIPRETHTHYIPLNHSHRALGLFCIGRVSSSPVPLSCAISVIGSLLAEITLTYRDIIRSTKTREHCVVLVLQLGYHSHHSIAVFTPRNLPLLQHSETISRVHG